MKYNLSLLEKLWQKYSYKQGDRYLTDRKRVIEEYYQETGQRIPDGTFNHYTNRMDLKHLYETRPTTFNERTDSFIDEPTEPLTEEQLILKLGFDPKQFELRWDKKVGTVNHWWLDRGSFEERIRNGQIKIDLWKKKFEVTEETISQAFAKALKTVKPIEIETKVINGKNILSIFLTDLHIGFMTAKDYERERKEIYHAIEQEEWDEIVFVIGSDLFHADNKQGTTTAGTQVAFEVDLNDYYTEAYKLYKPLIEIALEKSEKVKGIHIAGNHDENLSFGFVWGLSLAYPQIEWDLSNRVRKEHRYEDVLIIYTHGHVPRNMKDAYKIIFEEFKHEIATAKTVELHMGHLHHQWSKEDIGIVMRGLGSAKDTDKWHSDNGFIGSRQVMQLFIYDNEKLKGQLYI